MTIGAAVAVLVGIRGLTVHQGRRAATTLATITVARPAQPTSTATNHVRARVDRKAVGRLGNASVPGRGVRSALFRPRHSTSENGSG